MRVTLYTKPDCPLCDELKHELLRWQGSFGFELDERNIEQDWAQYQQFRYLIPVVDIEGGELLFPPHDAWEVERALREAMM
jgi:glutaredoxin